MVFLVALPLSVGKGPNGLGVLGWYGVLGILSIYYYITSYSIRERQEHQDYHTNQVHAAVVFYAPSLTLAIPTALTICLQEQ
jgi:hypothetical protein